MAVVRPGLTPEGERGELRGCVQRIGAGIRPRGRHASSDLPSVADYE